LTWISAGPFAKAWNAGMASLPALPRFPPVVELDLRCLPPPEPMRRILECLDSLRAGQCLQARTPFWPQPLLDRLRAEGWEFSATIGPGGDTTLRIHARDAGA
jgi:uncharacterized protein (DUF2249 family)